METWRYEVVLSGCNGRGTLTNKDRVNKMKKGRKQGISGKSLDKKERGTMEEM